MTDRERLRAMLREYSVRFGDFTLASGQKSSVYVDARLTTCRASAMPLIGRLFLEKFRERGWHPQAVGGLTMGADPISFAIAHESVNTATPVDAFVIRKEAKGHGMKQFVEGLSNSHGLPVVIIEDTGTTGASTVVAVERAREAGLQVLGAVCLVDRESGATANVERHCSFDRVFTLSELRA
jgi:orotate phosphoribosyltransferase